MPQLYGPLTRAGAVARCSARKICALQNAASKIYELSPREASPQGTGISNKATVGGDSPSPSQDSGGSWEVMQAREEPSLNSMAAQFAECFVDMRAKALEKLKAIVEGRGVLVVNGRALARVSPDLIVRLYKDGSTAEVFAQRFISMKQLEGCHYGNELMMLCLALDRAVQEIPADMINYRSTEVLCRRIYAIEKAFEEVSRESDWKAPKQAPKNWKSKILYHLLDEIDARALMATTTVVPAVDAEVRDRLKEKALLIKAVEKSQVQRPQADGA